MPSQAPPATISTFSKKLHPTTRSRRLIWLVFSQITMDWIRHSRYGSDSPVRIWNHFCSLTLQLTRESQLKGRFQDGYQAWRNWQSSRDSIAATPGNLVFNPGFEQKPLSETYTELAASQSGFDWIIGRHPEVRAPKDRSGKTQRLVFAGPEFCRGYEPGSCRRSRSSSQSIILAA
ncbi:MAG: hypothetical protein IPG76_21665 [Acidobacteria bacterium]|nr:hypothetical protein [Acidobacteriota bacterium]